MRPLAQLKLLLWKTFIIRRRRPVLLILELCWPVFVFLIVVAIRMVTKPTDPKACSFAPRAMPSGDLFSFLQSFVCNVDNACSNETFDRPFSKREKSSLHKIERLVRDEVLGSAIRDLPKSMKLLNFVESFLVKQDVKDLLNENFTIESFLKYPKELKQFLLNQIRFSPSIVSALYDSAPNFAQISQLPSVISEHSEDACNGSKILSLITFANYNQSEINKFEAEVCSKTSSEWKLISSKFYNALDVSKLLRTLSKVTTIVGDYSLTDGLNDIATMLDTVERLKNADNLVGSLAELKNAFGWIPDVFKTGATLQNPSINANLLKAMMSNVEKLMPQSGRDSESMNDMLSLTQRMVGLLNNQGGINVASLLAAGSNANVEDRFKEAFGTVRNVGFSDNAKQAFCQQNNSMKLSPQIREWRKVICKSNSSTDLWNDLSPYLNIAQKLATDELSVEDTVKRRIKRGSTFVENLRTEDEWKTGERIFDQSQWKDMIYNLLESSWMSAGKTFDKVPTWSRIQSDIKRQAAFNQWLTFQLETFADKKITFGSALAEPVSLVGLVETTLKDFDSIDRILSNLNPTPEMMSLMSQKSYGQALRELCTSTNSSIYFQLNDSTKMNNLTLLLDKFCKVEWDLLALELMDSFDVHSALNPNLAAENFTLESYLTSTHQLFVALNRSGENLASFLNKYSNQLRKVGKVKESLRRKGLFPQASTIFEAISNLRTFNASSEHAAELMEMMNNNIESICNLKRGSDVVPPIFALSSLALSLLNDSSQVETLISSPSSWQSMLNDDKQKNPVRTYLKRIYDSAISGDVPDSSFLFGSKKPKVPGQTGILSNMKSLTETLVNCDWSSTTVPIEVKLLDDLMSYKANENSFEFGGNLKNFMALGLRSLAEIGSTKYISNHLLTKLQLLAAPFEVYLSGDRKRNLNTNFTFLAQQVMHTDSIFDLMNNMTEDQTLINDKDLSGKIKLVFEALSRFYPDFNDSDSSDKESDNLRTTWKHLVSSMNEQELRRFSIFIDKALKALRENYPGVESNSQYQMLSSFNQASSLISTIRDNEHIEPRHRRDLRGVEFGSKLFEAMQEMINFYHLIKNSTEVPNGSTYSNFLRRLSAVRAVQTKNDTLIDSYVPLKEVLYTNISIKNVLEESFLNDKNLLKTFEDAEMNAYVYLFGNKTVDRKSLCGENPISDKENSLIRVKSIDAALCEFDFRSLFYVLEKSIDPNKVAKQLEKNLHLNENGQQDFLLQSLLTGTRGMKLNHVIDFFVSGSEVMSIFNDLSNSKHFSSVKKSLSLFLSTMEKLLITDNEGESVRQYMQNVRRMSESIKRKNPSLMPIAQLRDLISDPNKFVDDLSVCCRISNKQAQKLLAVHVQRNQMSHVDAWCVNKRLNASFFVAVDQIYAQEFEYILCVKHYPIILEKIKENFNEKSNSSESVETNWTTFFDDISFVSQADNNLSAPAVDALSVKTDYDRLIRVFQSILPKNTINISDYLFALETYVDKYRKQGITASSNIRRKPTSSSSDVFSYVQDLFNLLIKRSSMDNPHVDKILAYFSDSFKGIDSNRSSEDNLLVQMKDALSGDSSAWPLDRSRRMSEPLGVKLIEACEQENRRDIVEQLPVMSRYITMLNEQLNSLTGYQQLSCSESSPNNLENVYQLLTAKFAELQSTTAKNDTSRDQPRKAECANYVKHLEKLFDASLRMSQRFGRGFGAELLNCLKGPDGSVFRRTDRYLGVLSSMGKLISDPVVLTNVKQIEPAVGFFLSIFDRKEPTRVTFSRLIRDPQRTQDLLISKFPEHDYIYLFRSDVDVTMLNPLRSSQELLGVVCDTKKASAFFGVTGNDVQKYVEPFCKQEVANTIYQHLDRQRISELLGRNEKLNDPAFFDQVLEQGTSLFSGFTKIADYLNDVRSGTLMGQTKLTMNNLADTLINFLYSNKFDQIIPVADNVMKGAKQLVGNMSIYEDVEQLLRGVYGLEKVRRKILDLLNQNYTFNEVLINNEEMKHFIVKEMKLTPDQSVALLDSDVDFRKIFTSTLKQWDCDEADKSNFGHYLCTLPTDKLADFVKVFTKNIDPRPILNQYIEMELEPQMAKYGLSKNEMHDAWRSTKNLPSVLPNLSTVFQSGFTSHLPSVESNMFESWQNFTAALCGKPFQLSLDVSSLELDSMKPLTPSTTEASDLRELPNNFCRNLYTELVKTTTGTLLWKFFKPLLRGRIAVTPDTHETREIIEMANRTFAQIQRLADMAQAGVTSTESIIRLNSTADMQLLKRALHHPLVGTFLSQFANLQTNQFTDALNGFRNVSKESLQAISQLAAAVANVTKCISTNRFDFYDEHEFERQSAKALTDDMLLAGIVFHSQVKGLKKRSVPDQHSGSVSDLHAGVRLSPHTSYSIRMNPDRVPSPSSLLSRKINGGRATSVFEDLQYLFGFSLIQDAVDTAIVDLHSLAPQSTKIFAQQLPYPCAERDEFAHHLSLWLPLFMVFAWMFCVGLNVDALTHESELGLSQMMRSMGLSGCVQWLAWFISSFSVTVIASIFIVILLKVGQVLTYSNAGLIFLLMVDFEFAILMTSYLISVCFTKSTLATVTGVILYLISYLPFIIATSPGHALPFWASILTCLSAPTAFSYACLHAAFYEERGVGLQLSNMHSSWSNYLSFSLACWLIFVDAVLYGLIASYISRLRPKSGEPEQTFAFCLMPSFWKVVSTWFPSYGLPKPTSKPSFGESKIVSVRHLSKSYEHNNKNYRVFDLTFDMHENQVTTLLGPNGAGKTTTINMLTGVCQPTSGTAYIFGKGISSTDRGQALVGLCPQFNILFDQLTVIEHLEFYGKLKGLLEKETLKNDINRLLVETGLVAYSNEFVHKLSGGTRRRVCVAVAFVGGSRCVVLDEPTAGVDPLARRQIWEIIRTQKTGRTVLLCTHFMDEAEQLSDSVAILHKGKLLCCSTPHELKNTFGYGSLLKVLRTKTICGTSNTGTLMTTIKDCIPDVQLVEDIGRVLCIVIPYSRNAVVERARQIKNFAERIDSLKSYLGVDNYEIRQSTLEEVVMIVCKMSDTGLPLTDEVKDRWKFLNDDKQSTSSTNEADAQARIENKKPASNIDSPVTGFRLKCSQFEALIYKRFLRTRRDWRLLVSGLLLPCLFVALAMGCNVIAPKFDSSSKLELTPELYGPKSVIFFGNDNRSSLASTRYVDGLLRSESVGSTCVDDSMPNFENCGSHIKKGIFNTLYMDPREVSSFNGETAECTCDISNQICPAGAEGLIAPMKTTTLNNFLFDVTEAQEKFGVTEYLMKTHQRFLHDRYGGYTFGEHSNNDAETSSPYINVWFSSIDSHSLPSFLNGASNIRLRSLAPANSTEFSSITTFNHPFPSPSNSNKENLLQRVADVGIALVLLAAYSLIPASLIIYVVQERTSKQRQLQRLSGVGEVLYWTTNFIWDMTFYMGAVLLGCIIIAIFKLPSYTAGINLPATALLLTMYGVSVLPLMYILQSRFKDGTVAFVSLFCLNLFTGINTMVCVMLLSFFSSGGKLLIAASIAKKVFLVCPQYAMGGGLVDLTKNQIKTEIFQSLNLDGYQSPFSFAVLGYNYLALFLQFLLFTFGPFVLRNCFAAKSLGAKPIVVSTMGDEMEDEDVATERRKATEPGNHALLTVQNLSKQYTTQKWAVDKLCFHLNRGECFGLLGLNGAGKTTTFEMLTGGTEPTFGTVYLDGRPVDFTSNKLQADISYCPQENACDSLLTIRETLRVYGMLRGYRAMHLNEEVDQCISSLNLSKYENRLTGVLSGGYKRLTCFAVSLLGNPKVILLDEPTAGMDAKTRRIVWERLSAEMAKGRAVLLSTHSMDDSERLCTRLAIMSAGRLRCLGSSTHLKTKFGYGYTLRVKLHSREQVACVQEDLIETFHGGCALEPSMFHDIVHFIPGRSVQLNGLYSWISGKSRLIANYDVIESNLDELFISFIKKQLDKDKFKADDAQGQC